MKKNIIAFLLLFSVTALGDQKISQLPLGTAAGTTSGDSMPFVNSTLNVTERLTLYDLINLPPLSTSLGTKFDTIGAFGSSPSANGFTSSGTTFSPQPADNTHPGGVSTTTQTLGGNKTLSGQTAISNTSTTALTVNSTSLVVDATNSAVGVGTAPSAMAILDVVNNSGSNKAIQGTTYGANLGFRNRYANGTLGSPTAATTGNILNFFSGRGYGTSGFTAGSTGAVNITANATFSDTSMPTYLNFMVTPTGSVTAVEAARFAPTSNFLLGTTTDNATDLLQVNGTENLSGSSTGALKINTTAFIFDSVNKTMGIGIQPSTTTVTDVVANTASTRITHQVSAYGANQFGFAIRRAEGTSGSPTQVLTNDTLGFFGAQGYGATGFNAAQNTGSIRFSANENFTDTSNATYAIINTTPTGSLVAVERMRVNSTGNVLIGTTTDNGTDLLQVNGGSALGTVHTGLWNGTATAGQSFLTSGTTYTTPTTNTTATVYKFTLIGGGGGGGGIAGANSKGAGGGSGANCIVYLTNLAANTAFTIAIGAAGTAGAATPTAGGNGGNTTLTANATTYTAGGGTGGPDTVSTNGGAGGACTNTLINMTGQAGQGSPTSTTTNMGGGGGSGQYGMGGAPLGTTGNGTAATGFGGGGAGGWGAANTGGAGTQGAILVEWKN